MNRTTLFRLLAALLAPALALGALAQPPVPTTYAPSDQDRPPGVMPTHMYTKKDRKPFDLSHGVPLIHRSVLFGNPDKSQARISPDGRHISFLAPVSGVVNVWVGPASDLSLAKPVSKESTRGIRQHFWAYTSRHVLFLQDKGGNENWVLYAADLDSGEVKALTPTEGVNARLLELSEKFPDEVLVGLNDRNPMYHDVYRLNVRTGAKTLVLKNECMDKSADGKETPSGYASFITDDDFHVRFAAKTNTDGSVSMFKASDDGKGAFTPYDTIPFEDTETTSVLGFDKTGTIAYVVDGRDRNTAALFEMNVATKEKKRLLEDDNTDVQDIMVNPVTKKIEAAKVNHLREMWALLDPTLQNDFYAMRTQGGMGEMNVTSRSQDDRFWVVTFVEDDAPAKTCLLNRGDLSSPKRKPMLTTLFVSRQDMMGQPLVPMHPIQIKTRDGMDMVGYLSLPLEVDPDFDAKTSKPCPMVLLVHGGPWARDVWGFNATAQWLANRGYAVLQVNFRGSTGFGKKHINASNREWAGKMHDDLLDAVKWAVDSKIADPAKVAIMGGSYGGYATLVGLTFSPDTFACGVDIVGPSNLNSLLKTIPAYWQSEIDTMTRRVGDFRTEEGRKFLESRSPLTFVEKINKPLLIGQGANDPRVNKAEADQIVKAMTAKNIPVTYVLYPDEGHGFVRPANRISFNAVTEAFLAQHLNGRVEPFSDAFKGSSIQVPAGKEGIPGLGDAIVEVPPAKP